MSKLTAFAVKASLATIGRLPLGIARSLGSGLARLAILSNTRMVRVTHQNLKHCFPEMPENERLALAKQSILETGKLAFETAVIWTRSPKWVRNRILAVHNAELVTEPLAQSHGLLILAPHIGNWEVLNIYLAEKGDMTNMYQPPKVDGLEDIVRGCRSRCGAKTVPTDRKGLMAILSALKKGGMSGILPDQTPKEDSSGLFAPFFAHHAFTMTLAHKLITKSGAKPVFAYAKRVAGGFEIFFFEPEASITSDNEQDAVNALSQGIEKCARAIPEQYQWEYKRFKKRPPEDPDPYKKH